MSGSSSNEEDCKGKELHRGGLFSRIGMKLDGISSENLTKTAWSACAEDLLFKIAIGGTVTFLSSFIFFSKYYIYI